ncbi:MAG: GNAT family N-acetyltransferase [bacterium]|nr:GNAT family N-acetyltransferase [bacterium]
MKILKADIKDAEEILAIQKLAYQSEAELYNNYDIPPLTQTIDSVKEQFNTHIFLKAVNEDKIIGSVRACEEAGVCHVGRLAVHPDYQRQGIGSFLLKEIEKYFKPDYFELFSGTKSSKNIHLYQKLGYKIYKTCKYECGDIEIFYMRKNDF